MNGGMIQGGNEGCRFSRSIPRDLKRVHFFRRGAELRGWKKHRRIGNAIFVEFQTYFDMQTVSSEISGGSTIL